MLGKLGSTIAKSKKHPERSLVNRYFLSVAAHHPVEPLSEAAEEQHPLVPLGAVDDGRPSIQWPTNSSCRKKDPRSGTTSNVRERVLMPILGADVCNHFAARNNHFVLFTLETAIRMGRWKFNCRLREKGRQTDRTCASWFSIRARHVPHLSTSDILHDESSGLTADSLVYGRIEQFAELHLPHWRGNPWQLAQVRLYAGSRVHPVTQYPIIDTTKPLLHLTRKIEYVQVQHIVSMVAVAPCHALQPVEQPTPPARAAKQARSQRGAAAAAAAAPARKRSPSLLFVLPLSV